MKHIYMAPAATLTRQRSAALLITSHAQILRPALLTASIAYAGTKSATHLRGKTDGDVCLILSGWSEQEDIMFLSQQLLSASIVHNPALSYNAARRKPDPLS